MSDGSQVEVQTSISAIHGQISKEIDTLARGVSGAPGRITYPDPIHLDPVTRRLLVRSIFSLVEGVSYALKQSAVRLDRDGALTPAERYLARDLTFQVDDRGHVVEQRAHIRCMSNVRLAFALHAKAVGISDDTQYDLGGWASLCKSVKVRDRLMHPKSSSDLEVTNGEIRAALKGYAWFDAQLNYALDDVISSMFGTPRIRHSGFLDKQASGV